MELNESSIRKSMLQAGTYLLKRAKNDEVRDFWFGHNSVPPFKSTSNIFLNYFLVKALKEINQLDGWLTDKIYTELNSYKIENQYSYTLGAPPDADDTVFALRTLLLLGEKVSKEQVHLSLNKFKRNDWWLTFDYDVDVGTAQSWVFKHVHDGSIIGPHPEVHLNVQCLLNEINDQTPLIPDSLPIMNNCIATYHYLSNFYSNWLVSCITNDTAKYYSNNEIQKMKQNDGLWKGVELGFNTYLETALALLSIDFDENPEHICKSIQTICNTQLENGGWPSGYLWKYYVTKEGGGGYWYAKDEYNILSTSLMILVLKKALNFIKKS